MRSSHADGSHCQQQWLQTARPILPATMHASGMR
jgi:hypothetical protein